MSLTPAQWERIAEEFDRLHDLPTGERQRELDALAATDADVARELASLLDAADSTDSRLDGPVVGPFAEPAAIGSSYIGRTLGAYRITRVIGRGGMGVVFEGHHEDTQFAKRVAIKTLSIGVGSPEQVWRFRRERQILAGLEHPNIAALYDGGTTDDGAPYLVMEYVDGARIDTWSDTRRLTIPQRLDLFRQVCAAVHHAHTKLIVHRDLKPNNIFVTDDGVVKLLDFGIAKLLASDGTADETVMGVSAPLTLAYASPEQLRGDDVSTSSDVYSLGVVLYCLLTGALPHDTSGRNAAQVQELVSTTPPIVPSDGVTETHADQCGVTTVTALRSVLRGELDAIVLMALRTEPTRRYASADALSADLLRYLRGMPVQARPDTVAYRLRKFAQRSRGLVVGGALALLAILTGSALALRSAATATQEARRSQRMLTFLQSVLGAADGTFGGAIRLAKDATLVDVLDSAAAHVATSFADDPLSRADLYSNLGLSLRRFNKYERVLALFDSSRVLHTRALGAGSERVARDMMLAGMLLLELNQRDTAQVMLRAAIKRYETMRAPPDSDFAFSEIALGQLLAIHQIDVVKGVALLERGLARERTRVSPRPLATSVAEASLAVALARDGKFTASDSAFARAVAALEPDSLHADQDVAVLLMNWATMLSDRDEYADAIRIRQRALVRIERALGPSHMMTATMQSRAAVDYRQVKRLREARALIDSSLAVLSRLQPPNLPEYSVALRIRGQLQIGDGQLADATRSLQQALNLVAPLERTRPDLVMDVRIVQASLLTARHDTAGARRALRKVLADFTDRQGINAASLKALRLRLDSLGT